ncbi:hypothetical protein PC110_g6005 [Phytophthora cactorum]|uniref:M96 mating-specific protein family n=1 Tax=Phytophthora cactorum TaxID=29920 RepID=A0A329SMF8_9STRA|nr:hypothetical protein PC113_g6252 [Phytophthora cactorum]KAG2937138.1 hypothetical protein PC115_g4377 [Phytophthora cactorum]KAG3034831.1 hypothetical protein PC119_g4765 [Phytophthora cactorum]KAG3187104.1 hypothetical protein C6341_g3452 [Phytophthora cactorum]RAW37761.1 hypothetical protein PC110_g6005 [Phytophthora cactorum]
MAFLAQDDDAMRAFEAVLKFVDDFTVDQTLSADEAPNEAATVQPPVANGLETSPNGAPDYDHLSTDVVPANTAGNTRQKSRQVSIIPGRSNSNGSATRPVSDAIKTRRRAAENARKRMLRKAGVYGDPNRARNERKLEIAYLREKMGQLEKELQTLQERPDHTISERQESGSCATPCASAPTSCTETQVFSIWEGLAARQRGRREKAERENVRLKLVLEGQIKVAKSLENLLLKRAQQQIADCSSSIQKPGAICPPGRTLDFRADAADFQELLEYLDATYSEVDAVLAGNGLAEMEMTQQDLHMREGVDGMYLEVFSNKVMPFSLHATGEATWNYFKGSEKHRGNLYAKAAQSLDTPYTIIEHFSKELFAGNSCTDVRVKQIIRRYVEADREVVVWVATITPIEIKRKAFTGLTSHHRNYAVIKRAKASTPERELSLLQLVAHVTLDTEEGTIYDPMYIRALTDFLLSNAAGNIKADQELIENVLMDQTLDQH